MHGDKLVDLLIENEIGVTIRQVNVLELDEGSLELDIDEEVSTELEPQLPKKGS